jgi:hypothetical protein
MHSSSHLFVLHSLPISFSLTWSLHLEKSTSYETPHYAVFPTSCHVYDVCKQISILTV